jgi:hypothetical protein
LYLCGGVLLEWIPFGATGALTGTAPLTSAPKMALALNDEAPHMVTNQGCQIYLAQHTKTGTNKQNNKKIYQITK